MPIDVNGAPYPVKPGASAKLQASPSFLISREHRIPYFFSYIHLIFHVVGLIRIFHVVGLIRKVTKRQTHRATKKSTLPLFEIARLFVRPDHFASIIVNPDYSIM